MVDWQAEYVKAAELEEAEEGSTPTTASQQSVKTPVDNVLTFLDLLLVEEGGEWWAKLQHRVKCAAKQKSDDQGAVALSEDDKKQLKTLKKRLAAVGVELVIELPKLNASVSSKETPRSAKVRVLQLQLVCRVLCYGDLTKKKKEEKKRLKKEIRNLLDRVALLLDAANPPSLADEDADERSPFQEFLQQQLAPRLQMLLPDLVRYLLRAYELEEEQEAKVDENKDAMTALLPTPVVKPPQRPVELPKAGVTGKGSILSALRQERPAKRARPDASGLFKEVQLPHQLQQKQIIQSRPHKSRRISTTHSGASKSKNADKSRSARSSQDSLLRAAASAKSTNQSRTHDFARTAKTGPVSSIGKRIETDLLRRAVVESSKKGPAAPLLHRAMSDRSNYTGRQPAMSSSPGAARRTDATANNCSPPLRRAMTTSSVVMRTPDRPKRMVARTTRRVLVEASPPLRSLGAAPRLLQPKSLRPSGINPPSLFGNDSKYK
ncbi:hypothetical protein PPTG_05583 [Phytophthora nicotianae INRA-310]|uniref:Uncharacterized protein n=1 Tax=Phytophthora nicotianae (strain INRA-310) TaxID=761204 RepID=W2QZP1_PHYN3|nr:hypothetical protein PPTG_05583 [Phytophthora nicotianae INRA-310]ETN17914.1 hypothetical protein PPTG_05583 [Phytophthora nicotianae INRA-310]